MAFRSATILFAALVVAASLVAVRADENGTAEVVPDPSICTPGVMNLATSMNDSCPTSMFKRSNYRACDPALVAPRLPSLGAAPRCLRATSFAPSALPLAAARRRGGCARARFVRRCAFDWAFVLFWKLELRLSA